MKNFVFLFALCSSFRNSDLRSRSTLFVASARLRVLKKLLSLERAKMKNFVFLFALCSLIRNFVG